MWLTMALDNKVLILIFSKDVVNGPVEAVAITQYSLDGDWAHLGHLVQHHFHHGISNSEVDIQSFAMLHPLNEIHTHSWTSNLFHGIVILVRILPLIFWFNLASSSRLSFRQQLLQKLHMLERKRGNKEQVYEAVDT